MAKDKKEKTKNKTKRMACCGCARNRNSDIFCEDPMLSDQQQYRYMTVDDMKSMGDDSMRVNVTDDERDNRHSATTVTEMITKENYHRTSAANSKPDNIDINRHPVHVGIPSWRNFLVSFLVDARGGAMRGCRHSGVRVIVPPRKAAMPMRVTCRYLKRDKLTNPPPLMEGEALASRILELGPVGAKFLGPVIIEVPHFASLRGKEREIVILRSDNGETWREHTLEASEEAVQDVLNESFEGEELSQLEDLQTSRIVRVLTVDFPHYFAVVSRIRQEVHAVGPEGGTVSSSAVPQVQAVFPPAALTKKIRVGLQAHPIPAELVAKLLGNRVAVSPIVTVEPRRRKFHKPITLTIPVPQAANKGMINQYSGDAPTLRLLCSITGGQSRAVWEDVTGSTPLTFVKDCVSFTTTVSARFWLMDCRNITEATRMATELYTHATHVPFMAKFVVFAKRVDPLEARLRVFCMTDDKEDKTLEHQEHFTEVAKSRDVEVLEGKTQYMEFAGNLVPVMKSGEQLQLPFRAFKENRVPFTARVKDPDAADMVGRIMFMSEPKVQKGEPSQTPICTLNILLPEKISPEAAHSELDLLELSKNYSFLRDGGISRPDTIHRATIRLTDIANLLDRDWEKLAEELNITPNEVDTIKNEHPGKPALQAAAMFKLWQGNGNKATGNTLEKALNKIGREDIVKTCIFNVELVTDDVEKAVARVRLDQPGFDSLKEELGPSRDSSLRRDGTLDPKLDPDYEEPDRMRDSESVEDLSSMGNVTRKQTKQHVTITNGTVFNGTSTPIKDKYASEEKELCDDMAEFIAHKCHASDTMTKKSYDIPDDDNNKRQRIYEDANRLVTGVIQDAEKEKEKLAKEGWSGVYHDDVRSSNEAGGAVGQRLTRVNDTIITDEPDFGQSVSPQNENIEPLIVKQCIIVEGKDEPKGTIVSTKTIVTTQGDPKSGQSVITKTTTVREYDHPVTTESVSEFVPVREAHYFGANDPVIGLDQGGSVDSKLVISTGPTTVINKGPIIEEKIVTVMDSRSGEPPQSIALVGDNVKLHGQTVSFDTNVTTDRAKEDVAKSIAKVYPDCVTMLAETGKSLVSEKEKLSKEDKEVAEKTSKDIAATQDEAKQKFKEIKGILKSDTKKTPEKEKPAEDDKQSAYEVVYNIQQPAGDTKEQINAESKKQKDKSGGIFSGIFKGPKIKKSKSKDSKDMSFDSGDEEPKTSTMKFLEDTRKTADSGREPVQPSSIIHISVSPPTIEVSGPEYDVINATADFLEDSRRSAAVFHPQLNETEKTSGTVAEIKTKPSEEKYVTSTDTDDDEENKSKPGFFSSFFRSSKPKLEESIDVAAVDAEKAAEVAEEKIKKNSKDAKKDAKDIADSVKVAETKIIVAGKSDLKNIKDDIVARTKSHDITITNGTKQHADDIKKVKDTSLKGSKEVAEKVINDSETAIEKRIHPSTDDIQLASDKAKKSIEKPVKSAKTIADEANHTTEELMAPIKTDLKNIEETMTGRDKKFKDRPEIAGDESRDSDDDTKEKSGGFFGIFRSPKGKKRSRSKDKDSSKHESFDSGDEELRIATGAFLDDTRKASEKMYGPGIYEVQPNKDSNVEINRFVASNETVSDIPTDKVDRTSYDVTVVKGNAEEQGNNGVETLLTKVYSTSTKIIDRPEDPRADSAHFEDSQTSDDGKQKSFFGMFKSPKLKSRKKSRSRERSTSKEPSFESGDEEQQRELRDSTTKFLEDTRRTADTLHESIIEESTFVKNKTKPIAPEAGKARAISPVNRGVSPEAESGKISSMVTDAVETTTNDKPHVITDVKEKGGLFGIFKSPKSTLTRRSKSREKSTPADVSFDSGDEELRIATGTFLEDTRNLADAMAEPYNKDIRKGETETKVSDIRIGTDIQEKGEQKPQEKEGGFLFGILKGAKHAVEEVSEDVKEFWDDTKKEAAEDEKQARNATEEAAKLVRNAESETICEVLDTKDDLKDKASTALQRVADHTRTAEKYTDEKLISTNDVVLDAVKTIEQGISDSTAKATKATTDATEKLSKDAKKSKDAVRKEMKEDGRLAKDKISAEVKSVAGTADAAKDKSVKDAKKVKANTGGFLSGIFKGAKHATDEVSEDVKTFVEDTAEEAKKKEDKLKQATEEAAKSVKDSRNKIAADVQDINDKLAERVSAGVQKVNDETKAATEQAEKIATFAKDEVPHAVKMTGENITVTAGKADKTMTNAAEKLSTDITLVKDAVSKEIKDHTRTTKDKIVSEAEYGVEAVDAAKDETVKEAKKAKAKAGGFLSGIFKSAKHGADDVSEDVKEFVVETKQEAAKKGERAKQASEEGTKAAQDSKQKVSADLRDAKDKLAEGVSTGAKRVIDQAKAGNEQVKEAVISVNDATSDVAKTAKSKVAETADKTAKITTDAAEKLGEAATHAKDAASKKIKQDTKAAKDAVVAGVETVAETADAVKDKVKDSKKAGKGKAVGFLSGMFKGAKHSTDEVTDDVKDFLEETKKEAAKEEEEARRARAEAEKAAKGKAALDIQTVKDTLPKGTSVSVRTVLYGTKEIKERVKDEHSPEKDTLSDVTKEIGQKISETTAHAAEVTIDKAHKLGEDAENTKDILGRKVKAGAETTKGEFFTEVKAVSDTAQTAKDTAEKEAKKAKAKSGGFLSGIIKGAKHAVDEVSEDVKEFWDETKQEAADEEERARRAADETAKAMKDAEVKAALNVHETKASLKDKATAGLQDVIDHTKETEKQAEEKLLAVEDSVVDAAMTSGEKVSELTAKAAKTTTDAAAKVEKDAAKVKAAVNKEIKEDAKETKDKVASGAEAVAKTADAAKEKVVKDAKKAKGKASGFLTGIFKGAKHASDEVSEDVKELVEDTKREAAKEKEKAKHAAEETAKAALQAKDKIALDIHVAKDEASREATAETGKVLDGVDAAEKHIVKKTNSAEDALSNISKVPVNAVFKVSEDVHKTEHAIRDIVKSDMEATKDNATSGVETVLHPVEADQKEAKNMKPNASGFFSDVIKGAKHAVDDVSEEVKEFWDETKQEAAEKEERARVAAVEAAKTVQAVEDKAISESQMAKDQVGQKVSFAKNLISDAANATKEKVSETTVKAAKVTSDATEKLGKDALKAKDVASETLKDGVKAVREEVNTVNEAVVDTAEATKNKVVKDAKKAKAKGGGFLSGIFKGAKHTADETVADSREFLEESRREASNEKEKVQRMVDEASKKVEYSEDKVASNALAADDKLAKESSAALQKAVEVTDTVKDKLTKKTSDAAHIVADQTKAAKQDVKEAVISAKDALSETGDQILESTSKAIGATTEAAKKISNDAVKTTDAVGEGVEASIETMKAKVSTGAETTVDAVGQTKDALEKEAKKAKAKSGGFLSSIIKGAKHAVEEVSDDVKEFWDETKQEAAEEEECARRAAEEEASLTVQEVIDKSEVGKERVAEIASSAKSAASVATKIAGENIVKTAHKAAEATSAGAEKLGQGKKKTMDAVSIEIKRDSKAAEEKALAGAVIVAETADAAKAKIVKDAKKTKGKASGFLSGMFKGAKHVTDEVSEEGKEFVDDVKLEAAKEEEKVKRAAGEIAKSAKKTKDKVSSDIRVEKDGVAKQIATGTEKVFDGVNVEEQHIKGTATSIITSLGDSIKKTEKEISDASAQVTMATTDAVQKISDGVGEAEDETRKKIKTDVQLVKDKAATRIEAVVDTTNLTKDAMEKEANKAKVKSGGFLSSLVEGAKHVVDEVSDDVKEFWDETKQEAAEEEQRARRAAEEAAKSVQDAEHKTVSKLHAAKDDVKSKASAGVQKTIDHTMAAEYLFEQKLTSAEDAVSDATKATGEKVSDVTAKATEATTDAVEEISKDASEVKDAADKTIKDNMKEVKDKVTMEAEAVAKTADATKDKIARDAKKAKAKTGGFLSGIFKGAKHASDELEEDAKEFIEGTKQQTANEQEKAKHAAAEAEKSVKDSKDNVVADLRNAKDKLTEDVSKGAQKVVDLTKAAKEQVKENAASAKNVVADAAKATGEKVVVVTEKITTATSDTAAKLSEEAGKAKDIVSQEVKDDAKIAKDQISVATEAVAVTVDDAKDKVVQDAKKAKAKSAGFLSGIFKGAQSTGDDVSTDVKDFIEETKKEASREKEQANQAAEAAAKLVKDSADKAASSVHSATHKLLEDVSDEANDQTGAAKQRIKASVTSTRDEVLDVVKVTGENISDLTGKAAKATTDTAEKLDEDIVKVKNTVSKEIKKDTRAVKDIVAGKADDAAGTVVKSKDTLNHDAKKAKAKTGGFLSGIIKGAKHAVEDVSKDVKEFHDKTEQEVAHEEERARSAAEEAAKEMKKAEDKLISTKDALSDAAKVTVKKISDTTAKVAKASTDTAEKLRTDAAMARDAVSKEIKEDMKATKEEISAEAEAVSESADAAKDKAVNNVKKAKGKAGGFLSGIFKGAKHAADEVSEDVKEFTEDTKQKTATEAEKVTHVLNERVNATEQAKNKITTDVRAATDKVMTGTTTIAQKVVEDAKSADEQIREKAASTKTALADSVKKASKEISGASSRAATATTEAAQKLSEDIHKTRSAVTEKVHDIIETTKDKSAVETEAAINTANAAKKAAEKEAKDGKARTGGFFSGIIEGARHAVEDVSEEIKEFWDETKQEAAEEEDQARRTADEAARILKDSKDETISNSHASAEKLAQNVSTTYNKAIDDTKAATKEIHDEVTSSAHVAKDVVKTMGEAIGDTVPDAIRTNENSATEVKDATPKLKNTVVKEVTDDIRTVEGAVSTGTATVIDDASHVKDKATKEAKKTKSKGSGFLSGIFKGVKHSADEASEDVAGFVDETKHKVSKEEDRLQYAIDDATKSSEQAKDKAVSDVHASEEKLKEQVSSIVQEATEYTLAAEEDARRKLNDAEGSVIDAAKTTKTEVLHVTKMSASATADPTDKLLKDSIKDKDAVNKEITEDIKAVGKKVGEDAEALADKASTAKQQVEKEAHTAKTKGGGFLFGIIKGAKHAVDEVTEDVKEFWDETKQEATLEEEQANHAAERIISESHDKSGGAKSFRKTEDKVTAGAKVSPLTEVSSDFGSQPISRVAGSRTVQMSEDFSILGPESDTKAATSLFLEDSRQAASRRHDQPISDELGESSASEPSSARDSLERDGSPEKSKSRKSKKSKSGVISSIVKGAKGATHKIVKEIDHATDNIKGSTVKFWEETKQESKETFGSSGSYEVSSPLRETEVVREVDVSDTKSDVRLESFSPLDRVAVNAVAQSGIDGKSKSVSRIPQKISPNKEIKETKHVSSEKSDRLVAGVSSKLEHLGPRAHQTVTTVITKSVRTASTPPPSPAEFSDSSIKDVTEEAVKRAQSLADQALVIEKSESDFMQHSEPSYMETTTTDVDPETNERITRTARVITTTIPVAGSATGGSDELRESMQKIMDQFMTEERRGQ